MHHQKKLMMKYLFSFLFVTTSCTIAKPPVCNTEIFINYQGSTDKPIFPLVFALQNQYSGFYDGRYVVVVNRAEFEVLSEVVMDFKNVTGKSNNPDIQSFEVQITDSCKRQNYGTYGRINSIRFLSSLNETAKKFRPEVKATAEEFIAITRNRL